MPKLKSELFGDLALKEPEAKQFTVADPQDVTVTPFIEKSELFGDKRKKGALTEEEEFYSMQRIAPAPKPTTWERFKRFFVGEQPPLPPDADRLEKADRIFRMATAAPFKAIVGFTKGATLGAPDLMWAALKRFVPKEEWDKNVRNMTLDEAIDWYSQHDPAGFEKFVQSVAKFAGLVKSVAPLARKAGLIGRANRFLGPIEKAGETALLFGSAGVAREASKAAAGRIDPTKADYGYEGPVSVLTDMALGAILSIAHSGAEAVWGKLKPSEEVRILRMLNLKKGASLEEIEKAAKEFVARKPAVGQVKRAVPEDMREFLAKSIARRVGFLRKGDVIVRGRKPGAAPKLLTGEARKATLNEIMARRAQQIEQIKAEKGIGKDAAQEIKKVIAEGQKEIDQALKGISEEKKAESIRGIAEPVEKAEQAEPVKPEEPESPAGKLLRLIRYADTVETEQKKLRHKELSRRVGRVAAIQKQVSGEKALIQAKAALKGQLPAAQFTPPRLGLTEADINSLHDDIRLSGKLSPLEIVSAQDGLNTIIDDGRVPQRSKLKLLERVFGKELVKALLDKRSTWEKAWSAVVDIANLPRTLLTAYDLSAAMRQTWLVAPRHPAIWTKALGSQIKAFGSAKHANSVMDSIRNSKWYDDAVQFGLYLPDPESTAEGLAERPEEFMSRLALEIPGVRASERAFITMGNKVRFELWSKYCDLWKDSNKPASAYKALAKYLNAATGRGNLGQLSKYMPMMNAAFFSPRWTVSRFQAISALSNKDVRKIVAGDLASFVLANLALLAALKAFWGDKVEVELDPRSSDFGKVRVGNTRFDFWAGYQQLARHITQLAAGERKTLATKEIRKASRKEVLARYARSKLAPVPAFVVDLWTGKTYTGDEMKLFSWGYWQAEPTKWEMTLDVADQLRKRFAPLSFQDIGEAFYYQGGGAALATIPAAILGMGVGTWKVDVGTQGRLLKDELARKYYGVKWNDLGPTSQRALRIREPRIAELERRARVKGQSISYLNRIVAEQQKAAEYVRGKLAPVIRQEMKRLYIRVPALSRRSGEWTMNDKWYAEYQKLAAQEINKRLKDIVSKPDWTNRPEESRRRIIEAGISAATERARNIIKRRADQEIKK